MNPFLKYLLISLAYIATVFAALALTGCGVAANIETSAVSFLLVLNADYKKAKHSPYIY